jgi:hypothetical protein
MAEVVVSFVTSKLIDGLLEKITSLIQERRKLYGELRVDLEAIKGELEMVNANIRKEDEGRRRGLKDTTMTQGMWIRHISELAYDIEDCIDLHTGNTKGKSTFSWLTRRASITQFAEEIKSLRSRVEKAEQHKLWYVGADDPVYRIVARPAFVAEKDLVGIGEPKQKVLALLGLEGAEDCCNNAVVGGGGGGGQQQVQPKSLKVVSIVGPRGLGKTTLARVVYESLGEFECRAWVDASECMDGHQLLGVLARVLDKTSSEAATTHDAELGAKLAKHLETKAR